MKASDFILNYKEIDVCVCGYTDESHYLSVIENLHELVFKLSSLLEDQINDYSEHINGCPKGDDCNCGAARWMRDRDKTIAVCKIFDDEINGKYRLKVTL